MLHRQEFRAMGSRMLGLVDCEAAPPVLEGMPAKFEEWEQVLSRFRFDSELCELNRRPGRSTNVSPILWEVFEASRLADEQTGGLVNPLISEALVKAGYDRSFDTLDRQQTGAAPLPIGRGIPQFADVSADPGHRSLRLPEGAELDFGGIAKGWAANQAMRALSAFGPALFSAGGDLAISGPQSNGEPWEITVDDPFRPGESIEVMYVERGGVATSGKDKRRWMRGGVSQHHIIDPRTASSAETDVLTATVVAPNSILAEAFAKAVLIVGSEAGLSWINDDERLEGLLVLDNGRFLYSRNMGEYL